MVTTSLARLLVEKEVIFAEDVERIFGKRPWTSRSEEIMALEATVKLVEVTEDFEEKKSSDSEEKEKEKKKHNIVERSVNHNHVILNDIKSL